MRQWLSKFAVARSWFFLGILVGYSFSCTLDNVLPKSLSDACFEIDRWADDRVDDFKQWLDPNALPCRFPENCQWIPPEADPKPDARPDQ